MVVLILICWLFFFVPIASAVGGLRIKVETSTLIIHLVIFALAVCLGIKLTQEKLIEETWGFGCFGWAFVGGFACVLSLAIAFRLKLILTKLRPFYKALLVILLAAFLSGTMVYAGLIFTRSIPKARVPF